VSHALSPVSVSVVIPVLNAAAHLTRSLAALATSTLPPIEVIVVDDGSSDASPDVARQGGAIVVRVPDGPRGPAVARNAGAALARGDVIFFVDADVLVHPDTVEKTAGTFVEHQDVAAVFGSYDDRPDHSSLVSRYRNLLHHYVHQQGSREASTFWAGCGAVRRSVFAAVGGFDERYTRPSIEDIELGVRLRAAGHRILLKPDIQVTHLKRWTFTGTLRSDIRDRAIPWTRLILAQSRIPDDLNTSRENRVAAGAAWVLAGGLAVLVVALVTGRGVAALAGSFVAAGGAVGILALNRRLYVFLLRKGGPAFAAGAVAMHALYLLYSSAVFGALYLAHQVRGGSPGSPRSPGPAV
jgi:hypothetical protein